MVGCRSPASVGPVRRVRWRAAAATVVAATLALAVAACGSAARTAAPAPTPVAGSPLRWAPCQDGEGPPGAQCATLTVPLDPTSTAPGGPTTTLALDRLPATGHRTGSLVLNPGGPGVSAVDALPDLGRLVGADVREHLDLVGWDPPGVGHSDPTRCLPNDALGAYLHEDPAPPGAAGFAQVVADARSFAAACRRALGPLLDHVRTADAARQLDKVRAALGDARLTYLGFSYGTLLGATYAAMFPTHVRAMVLDGALDPSLAPLPALEAQAAAVDRQFGTFAAACRAAPDCPWRPGADPAGALLALVARSRARPLPAGSGRVAGPAEVLYGVADALYSPSSWPVLEQALADAGRGRGDGLVALFDAYVERGPDGAWSTTTESEVAVNCTDVAPPTLAQVQAAADASLATAPLFGPLDLDAEATCAVWPAAATGPASPLHAPGAPPIVVVGSTGDPITPYAWARSLAAQLGTATLLTRVGDGHTAYGASGCVRAAVDRYLLTTTPPPPGTTCPTP